MGRSAGFERYRRVDSGRDGISRICIFEGFVFYLYLNKKKFLPGVRHFLLRQVHLDRLLAKQQKMFLWLVSPCAWFL